MRPRRSVALASPAARASTWWRSRTRPTRITSSSALCAPAIPGRCSGLPPVWYKSPPYRSRAVIDPRGVLAEFGVESAGRDEVIRVWDSTAEIRYLVIPMRPAGTRRAGAKRSSPTLVTRDSMIGTGASVGAGSRSMNGPQDLGGQMGFGPVAPEKDEPVSTRPGNAALWRSSSPWGRLRAWNIDISRHARESLAPAEYLASSYYEIWLAGLRKLMLAARPRRPRMSWPPAIWPCRRRKWAASCWPKMSPQRSPKAGRPHGPIRPRAIRSGDKVQDAEYASRDPYAAAALFARSCG